jgi:hypothetical protein
VEQLAAEQADTVRGLCRRYIEHVSPVLGELLSREGMAPPPAPGEGCLAWQDAAPAIAAEAHALHVSFRRLFVPDQVDEPVDFSAAALLRQAAAAQASLTHHAGRLCAPSRTSP